MSIYPSSSQKEMLQMWTYDARLTYNSTVSIFKEFDDLKVRKETLRDFLVTSKNTKVTDPHILWAHSRTPKDIRAKSVFEAHQANDLARRKLSELIPLWSIRDKTLKKFEMLVARLDKKKEDLDKCSTKPSKKKDKILADIANLETKTSTIDILRTDLEHTPKYVKREVNLNFRKKKAKYSHIWIPKSSGLS